MAPDQDTRAPAASDVSVGEGRATELLSFAARQAQDLVIGFTPMEASHLRALADTLAAVAQAGGIAPASTLAVHAETLSAKAIEAATVLESGGDAAASTASFIHLASDFLFLPEVSAAAALGVTRQAVEGMLHTSADPSAHRRIAASFGLIPLHYQEFAPQIERLCAALLPHRGNFDVCVFTGRSGVGIGAMLASEGILTVELPPFRQTPEDPENRPDIPVSLTSLREKLAGKRVLFVDDQIGSGTTLQYVRLATAACGGTMVGAAMYREKFVGETAGFLAPTETEYPSGTKGASDGSFAAAYPTLESIYQYAQRRNPFQST